MRLIGALAAAAGVRPSAIRYYEAIGLLPKAERVCGRRVYPDVAVDRLDAIALAKAAGLSLSQIREALGGDAPQASDRWQRVVAERRVSLAHEQDRLALMQKLLAGIDRCGCPTVEECGRAFRLARERHRRRRFRAPRG